MSKSLFGEMLDAATFTEEQTVDLKVATRLLDGALSSVTRAWDASEDGPTYDLLERLVDEVRASWAMVSLAAVSREVQNG